MKPMTLRTEIEALLVEFDHFAYDGAPLDVAVEKLQEILARTAPRVLTTVEELNSEEASKALCLVPNHGGAIFSLYDRFDGVNQWSRGGFDYYYSSDDMVEDITAKGNDPAFTLIEHPGSPTVIGRPARRVLTTLEELDSEEAFKALCIVQSGGPLRVASSRSDGVNYWQGPGLGGESTSAEMLAHFASIDSVLSFTLIEPAWWL